MLTESTNNLTYEKLSQDEMQSRGILGRLVGVCADFMSPTRNGRKYPEKLWENIFNSDIMKERIANGVCFGELGHPADREETDMEKICICMPEEPKKGPDGKLRAVFDILDTPNGRILKSLCDYGSTLGISSRGSGDLETDFSGQESVNPDTYNCEGFDIVLLPGVKDARLQYVTESLHMNEGAVTPKKKINLEAREFNYTMQYGTDTTDIHSAVVVIPNGLKAEDGTTTDASVHCEDLNGNVIDFTSVKEAQDWIDNYGDSCVYYIKNGTELHATPEEAYDESRAIELESVNLNKKRNHKTLRQQLQESINNETDDNKKIMKESLNTLGIDLKDLFTVEFQYDEYNDDTDKFDFNLIGRFNVYANTPEQAIKAAEEYCDKYGFTSYSSNYSHFKISNDTYTNSKEIYVYSKNELLDKFGTDDINIINAGNEKTVMLEKLTALNSDIDLEEDTELNERKYSKKELIDIFTESIDDTLNESGIWDKLSKYLSEAWTSDEGESLTEGLTPEEKMDAWHNGTRRQNIKACSDTKLVMYHNICKRKGYTRESGIIEKELNSRGIGVGVIHDPTHNTVNTHEPKEDKIHAKMLSPTELGISTRTSDANWLDKIVDVTQLDIRGFVGDDEEYFVIEKSDPYADIVATELCKVLGLNESLSESDDEETGMSPAKAAMHRFVELSDGPVHTWSPDGKKKTVQGGKVNNKVNNEVQETGDNDTVMIDELQEALKLNKMLDEKIVHLQEKLSASYAKEMKLEESITSYKTKVVKLSNKNKEIKALNEKLSKLETELKESNDEVQSKKNTLQETMRRDATERKSLQESIESKDNKIAQLSEKLKKATQDISAINENVNALNEQLETAHKDNRQLKEKYSKKLEQNNQLIEKYKNIAKNAVDKYINKQATILGTTSQEIKNRLPESYTFKDIDNICENLREYKVNMNSLPFNATLNESINFNVKNADERVLYKNLDDEISDADIKLAEKFIR